jgi:hypothetical protein
LLTMLNQALLRLNWVYQQSRLRQGDVLESDKARAVRKMAKPAYNPKAKVIVVSG